LARLGNETSCPSSTYLPFHDTVLFHYTVQDL